MAERNSVTRELTGPIQWAERETWVPWLSGWLEPHLKRGAVARMRKADSSKFYADDPDWSRLLQRNIQRELQSVQADLADTLGLLVVRVFHGCRTEDAGSYHRHGIRVHDRNALVADFRRLVDEDERLHYLRRRLDEIIERVCSKIDDGRCFVVLDARVLLEHAAHYLIYGSDLICGLLAFSGREVLLERELPR